ncbi:MAG: TrmH family RNA methyltransferase [Bdellovibrionales bacterium]
MSGKLSKLTDTRLKQLFYNELLNLQKGTVDFTNFSNLLTELSSREPNKFSRFIGHDFDGFKDSRNYQSLATLVERDLSKNVSDLDIIEVHETDNVEIRKQLPLQVILEDCRSSFNIGSIFRSAEAFGFEKVVLAGYSSMPDSNLKTLKSAMGTTEWINYESITSISDYITKLKLNSYKVYGLETAKEALDLAVLDTRSGPVAVVLGNERFGIKNETLKLCDASIRIPLFGRKNSLNVANAFSVFAYQATLSQTR